MDSYTSNKTIQDHKSLTCSLCTRYYNDPRLLPCHHTFCFICIKTLCDKSVATPTSPKKQKIICPKCKVHFNTPVDGADGFPVDHKTQALKEKVIQELAKNISRTINNPRDDEPLSRFSTTSPIGGTKLGHGTPRDSYQAASDRGDQTPSNKSADNSAGGGSYSMYGDYSKYAKYFSPENNVDSDSYYKPTIRSDHTRIGYESSARFRNRRKNSKERQGSEEKELRRRTWYGSTLQSRRAQSLNRSSMFVDPNDSEKKSENLFNISEDREQAAPNDASSSMPTFGSGTPLTRKSSFESNNKPAYTSRYRNNETNTAYFQQRSPDTNADFFEKSPGTSDSTFDDEPKKEFNPRSGLGGPTRTSLPTHRENVVTGNYMGRTPSERKKEKDRSPPVGSRTSHRTGKRSPKVSEFGDKNFAPAESPKVNISHSPEFAERSFEQPESEPRTFVGKRHHRINRSKGVSDPNWRDGKFEYDFLSKPPRESGRAHSAVSREKLHLIIGPQEPRQEDVERGGRRDSSPRRSRSRKTRKGRCRSVESRYSLNKNDFENESEFREHLLNMTMSKERYQDIMGDFKRGHLKSMRCDSIGSYDNDPEDEDRRAEVLAEKEEENKENVKVDGNKVDDDVEEKVFSEKTEDLKSPKPPKEPLIDENLISSFRAKYSSSLDVKRFPKQEKYPEFCDGITKRWSCQKNDFGVPTSAIFLGSGNLVVADYGQSFLEFFDSKGQLEHTITGIKPYGMARSANNQNIIVGDRKGKLIRIFDEFGADVSQIEGLGSPEWLAGIAAKREGGLVMCDRGRCKIIIATGSGEKIKEFGSFGSSAKQLCMADFLAVDSKGRIVVADSGNHCIKIFDPEGNHLKSVGSRGSGDGQLEWPKGIAVDEDDNIIVADTLNHRVSLFTSDGEFIKHLMSSIPDPYNIAWSKGSLAVLHYNLKGMSQYDVYTC